MPRMRIILVILMFSIGQNSWGWGLTGHRVVAGIAEQRLNTKGKALVKEILVDKSLPEVANWMDFIKSSDSYKYLDSHHYVNIEDNKTYIDSEKNPKGDIVKEICSSYEKLKSKNTPIDDRKTALKILVHLIGDIHQPLHVGSKEDLGGYLKKAKWFGKATNLHLVWDEELIDSQKLSYTEYVSFIYKNSPDLNKWEKTNLLEYVNESNELRLKIYSGLDAFNSGKGYSLTYRYIYDHIDIINKRLLQAGVRLAKLIDDASEGKEITDCQKIIKK